MEIEAKPRLTLDYVRRQLDYLESAHVGKFEGDEWHKFVQNTAKVFLVDMQAIAEHAFELGREFERRNRKDQP